jgi:L-amino acid N-acyltransferase YncA
MTMPITFPIDTRLKDGSPVRLAVAEPKDVEAVRRLFKVIVDEGTSYPHEQSTPDKEFQAYWFGGDATVVASVPSRSSGFQLAGAYYVKANWPGRASHVANAGFIVAPEWRGKGLGRLLGETMLDHARALGFRSVIFNLVFAENRVSRHLWKQLGFRELATIPQAVRKNDGRYQEAVMIFRSLVEDSE